MPAASLRRRLLLLAAVAIVPLAVMSGIALTALLDQQREQTEQSTLDLTRALATAVETELRLTISALQTLAASEPLAGDRAADIEALYRLAQRIAVARPEWRSLLLAEPSGKVLFDTPSGAGGAQPATVEPESFAAVLRTRAPVIGSLMHGRLDQAGVPVRVPVMAGAELRYVLTAVVKPDAIVAVIDRQRVPADWIVSVFDAKNVHIAHSRNQGQFLGARASPSLQALQARAGDEAIGSTTTLEGGRVNSAMTRIRSSGWSVAMGVPSSPLPRACARSARPRSSRAGARSARWPHCRRSPAAGSATKTP